jgi:hypothetical protein
MDFKHYMILYNYMHASWVEDVYATQPTQSLNWADRNKHW